MVLTLLTTYQLSSLYCSTAQHGQAHTPLKYSTQIQHLQLFHPFFSDGKLDTWLYRSYTQAAIWKGEQYRLYHFWKNKISIIIMHTMENFVKSLLSQTKSYLCHTLRHACRYETEYIHSCNNLYFVLDVR